jgi:hypothetical protein
LVSIIYRSNGALPNVTKTAQLDRFLNKFDNLLNGLAETLTPSYIFMDSNIDSLRYNNDPSSRGFLDLLFSKGFLQINMKVTRMQDNAATLIDQIFTNAGDPSYFTLTLVSDISDHFFTGVCPFRTVKNHIQKKVTRRLINDQTLAN